MGRRKIEIKAIKDDRNRSVTFLKRKGGLFKKAYELSVLCSADVAIIIFGNNKKLYEFSSANIDEIIERRNFFGLPHERKGPDDYQGKGSDNEDDEDEQVDVANGMRQSNSPPMHQRSNSNPYVHGINGRHLTPQPPMSRPLSRNAPHPHHQRHLSQGTIMGPNGPQMAHHPMAPGQPNGFTYVNQYPAGVSQPPVQTIPPGYSFPAAGNPAAHAFIQQQQQQQHESMMRRTSMPGALPPQHHAASQQEQSTPPHINSEQPPSQPQIQVQNDQGGEMETEAMQEDPANDNIARARTKSRSIFTPIAGESSLLAQHWFGPNFSPVRANSVDNGAIARKNMIGESSIKHEITAEPEEMDPRALPLIRTGTGDIPPPTRTPSLISTPGGGLKRPVLKVQIPNDEEDDTNANTAGTSPRNSGLTADPISARPHTEPLPPGAVLPPPSPSVGNNAPLSAGTSGPPNPYARPPPTSAVHNPHEQTPISALPSRFMGEMLPSPSSFFADGWDPNMLPSPLNFKTPILGRNFMEEDNSHSKRKSPDSMDVDSNGNKRVKT